MDSKTKSDDVFLTTADLWYPALQWLKVDSKQFFESNITGSSAAIIVGSLPAHNPAIQTMKKQVQVRVNLRGRLGFPLVMIREGGDSPRCAPAYVNANPIYAP